GKRSGKGDCPTWGDRAAGAVGMNNTRASNAIVDRITEYLRSEGDFRWDRRRFETPIKLPSPSCGRFQPSNRPPERRRTRGKSGQVRKLWQLSRAASRPVLCSQVACHNSTQGL